MVPPYTAFAVLARLGNGIPTWEVLGSGALLAIFVLLEIVLLGREFRASLLAEGRRKQRDIVMGRLGRQPIG